MGTTVGEKEINLRHPRPQAGQAAVGESVWSDEKAAEAKFRVWVSGGRGALEADGKPLSVCPQSGQSSVAGPFQVREVPNVGRSSAVLVSGGRRDRR